MHNTQREIRVRVARGPARFRCGCAKVASFGESRVPADQSHRQWEEGIDSRSDVRTATTLPIPTTCLYPLPCFTARKYEHLRKTKILGVLNEIKGCTIVLLNTVQHRTNCKSRREQRLGTNRLRDRTPTLHKTQLAVS